MTGALLAFAVASVVTGVGDVRSLAATDGVRWVGSTGGLVRIEGSEQRILTPRDGLPDGTIRALLAEGDRVVVGTDRGLAFVHAETGRIVRTVGAGHRITALQRHEGALYVGTDRGVYRVRSGALELVEATGQVRALASLPDGLYAGTANRGSRRFAATTEAGGDSPGIVARSRRLRGHRLVWDFASDGEALWVVTPNGLEKFVGGRRQAAREIRAARAIVARGVRSIAVADGELVLGAVGGAWRYQRGHFRQAADTEGRVVQTIRCGEALTLGTGQGLTIVEGESTVTLLEGGLPSNDLTGLARTAEGLWVGTFRHGLVLIRRDGSTLHFDERHGLVDARINRLTTLGDDLWIATDRGVARRTGERFELVGLLDRHVSFVAVVGSTVYAGAGDALYMHSENGFEVVSQPGVRPQDVAAHERLVVASAEGLAIEAETGFELATSDETLPDDWVTATEYLDGSLFVGTYNAGVARIEGGEATVVVPDVWVNAGALQSIGEVLAIGTLDEGLWLTGEGGQTRLTTQQGLPDNDVTSILPEPDGSLWVATRGGLARVVDADL